MRVIVAGDFCERYRVADAVENENYEQLFDSEVCSCIKAADYSLVNFEFPIVVGDKTPIEKCGPNLKGTPQSINAIKYAGFKGVTLANNHSGDFGPDALIDTRQLLQQNGVDTVGVGANLEESKKVLYKTINGKVLAIINCCEHEFGIATHITPGANPLNPVQQYYSILEAKKNADYVMVIVHGGHEHWQLPSLRMVETYRYFIDCGADAVVNHHQHCYSGYEVYKGKPIFYGLGNFCFDIEPMRTDDKWNYGCMAQIDFLESTIEYKLIPIKQCDENVMVRLGNQKDFDKKQSELNTIIEDSNILQQKNTDYYCDCMDFCRDIMNPTQNRYLKALQRRKLLSSPVTRKWLTLVMNFTLCESHRDKMQYFFENN